MAVTATKPRANAKKTANVFWWIDLQTTDVAAAQKFYGATLGWDFREERDETGAVVYQTAHIGGLKLAGMSAMSKQAQDGGMPPMWSNMITVTDIDATCAKATKVGGTIVMPAMDVMKKGRMAIISDPTGAMFGLWEVGTHDGADAVNQPSTYTWVELYSKDEAATRSFYEQLFGWKFQLQDQAMAGKQYWMIECNGEPFGGLMEKSEDMLKMPDMWLPYIGVADVEAAKREVEQAGGTVMWGPMQTGPGRTIGIKDPQGAMSMLMQLDEWPAG